MREILSSYHERDGQEGRIVSSPKFIILKGESSWMEIKDLLSRIPALGHRMEVGSRWVEVWPDAAGRDLIEKEWISDPGGTHFGPRIEMDDLPREMIWNLRASEGVEMKIIVPQQGLDS